MIESVDRRVLGGFICVDAITGSSVVPAIPVTAPQWTVRANRSGVYVIFDGPQLDLLTGQFIPSGTWPAATPFQVALQDHSRKYLPRRVTVNAPLAVPVIPPAPVAAAGVFVPQQVPLYPSPSAAIGQNWATIHASVTRQGSAPPQGLPWAILRVVHNTDNSVLATGQTDLNGEALLAVIGLTVQANASGTGPVTVSSIAATVTAYFDPSVLAQPKGWIPNPDDILTNLSNAQLKSATKSVQLSSGLEQSLNLSIAL